MPPTTTENRDGLWLTAAVLWSLELWALAIRGALSLLGVA